MKITKKTSVVFATFSPWQNGLRLPINGNLEPMVDYLKPRSNDFTIIDQPYPGSDFVLPRIEHYQMRKQTIESSGWLIRILLPLLHLQNTEGTRVSFKLRDFLSVLDTCFRRPHTDVFIGFESINVVAGVLVRKLGKVSTVVYYVSDYAPNRYGNTWFNLLYVYLDRWCARHADYIWDVSPAMQPARLSAGLDKDKSAPVIVVPNALYPEQLNALSLADIKKNTIVFLGTFGPENGPDLLIKALPWIRKEVKSVMIHFYGGPDHEEKKLKRLANKLNVEQHVTFHGFINDRVTLSNEIRKYAIAAAPYRAIDRSVRWYADATKIRTYMGSGLPVITTNVPPLGTQIQKKGAGIIVKDNAKVIARELVKLMSSQKRYKEMRKRAIAFALKNTWDNEFYVAFSKMK